MEAQIRLHQRQFANQPSLFVYPDEFAIRDFVENLSNSNIHTIGPELIFGRLFDRLGFNEIEDELFRHIVIARLAYPASKLKTVDYLQRYKNIFVSVGNTFEGHTLLPTIQKIQQKYGFKQPIVVADAALLSGKNLATLSAQQYRFIIGARIKNESNDVKQKILQQAKELQDGDSFIIKKLDKTRLIITFSEKRRKKDEYNRIRGLNKLRLRIKTGKLTKSSINNRGYNKFLSLSGEIEVEIDESKIEADKQWNGPKGYLTNTRLSAKKVVANYGQLWQIEKAFRISKTDLRVRPIFHQRESRIEAHICIAFVAYAIYKELERILYQAKAPISVKRASELTHTMYEIEYFLPKSLKHERVILKMSDEQELLRSIIEKSENF